MTVKISAQLVRGISASIFAMLVFYRLIAASERLC
jgi:hypothetical protein